MRFLKQSTSVDLPVGPFLDATDGVTAETTLTITQADIRLKKNGGAWAQKNAAQTLSHEENGNYELTLDATDTDTLGLLRLHIAESGALPVWEDFMVMPANVWDSLFGADALQVHAVEITNGLITAAAIADNAIDAGAIAADAITAAKIADGAIDAATFAAGAINAAAIAADAITAAKIADGAIDAATFAAGAIDATAIANGAIDAATFAAGAIDAAALASDAGTELADAFLNRNLATGTDSGSETTRTVRQALRILRNKVSIAAGTMTVTKEDDTTASWTAAVTTAAGDPIDSIDPTSA